VPADNELLATSGVFETGNATTTDSVGGATVVVGATVVDGATVVIETTVVVGATVVVEATVVVGAGVLLTAVIVNASYPPAKFVNNPAATQLPADAHDTE
jgi:UDP-3-O-[3-hydroxymyristoyl] glucosamine N-acyltransferase